MIIYTFKAINPNGLIQTRHYLSNDIVYNKSTIHSIKQSLAGIGYTDVVVIN